MELEFKSKNNNISILKYLFVLLLAVSCTTVSKFTLEKRMTFSKCAACHLVPTPEKYSQKNITVILNSHEKRIMLSEKEKELIIKYFANN